jgi:hypothetical protein
LRAVPSLTTPFSPPLDPKHQAPVQPVVCRAAAVDAPATATIATISRHLIAGARLQDPQKPTLHLTIRLSKKAE